VIGRRFRLCHIRFGRKVVEVSTFRRQAEPEQGDTLIRRDNTFGTPEEDAFRRDFTVNALFYDIATFSVIDYVEGLEDLESRVIRTIGDPAVRFREDPVRMLRAVALAARLGFTIDRDTAEAIRFLRGEIVKSSPARILDELYKVLRQGRRARPSRCSTSWACWPTSFPRRRRPSTARASGCWAASRASTTTATRAWPRPRT
jgi:poly(A) polymerase